MNYVLQKKNTMIMYYLQESFMIYYVFFIGVE